MQYIMTRLLSLCAFQRSWQVGTWQLAIPLGAELSSDFRYKMM